jgi:AraC family transcriptional regulator
MLGNVSVHLRGPYAAPRGGHGGLPAENTQERELAFANAGLGVGIEVVRHGRCDSIDWDMTHPQHKLLVWRHGVMKSKEAEFEGGPRGRIVPRPSNLWIIPAGMRSSGGARDAAFEYVDLTIPTSAVRDAELKPVLGRRDPLVHQLVERLCSTTGRDDVVSRLLRESLTDSLRLHLLDAYGSSPAQPERGVREFDAAARQQLIDFLHDSLDQDICTESLAELVGMPVARFRRVFARSFRVTPHQFVLDLRIEKAKSLLVTSGLPVAAVAARTGFASPSHFATTFKSRVGVTPTAYRADQRQGGPGGECRTVHAAVVIT